MKSLTLVIFLFILVVGCKKGDQQAEDHPLARRDTIYVPRKLQIDPRYLIQRGQVGNLKLGAISIKDAVKEYPEMQVDTLSAYTLGYFYTMTAYQFSKNNKVQFYLMLKNAQAEQDTIDAAEIVSPEFQTVSGTRVGTTISQLLKVRPDLTVTQCNFEYESCETSYDAANALAFVFNTTLETRMGTYDGEEDSKTFSTPTKNLNASIAKIKLTESSKDWRGQYSFEEEMGTAGQLPLSFSWSLVVDSLIAPNTYHGTIEGHGSTADFSVDVHLKIQTDGRARVFLVKAREWQGLPELSSGTRMFDLLYDLGELKTIWHESRPQFEEQPHPGNYFRVR